MPRFEITAPDGKVFDVEGPEGSTAEQALAQVRASYKPAAPAVGQSKPSFLDRVKDAAIAAPVGAGEALLSIGSGAVAQAGSTIGAIAGQVATGGLGDPAAARRAAASAAETAQGMTYQPRTEAGKSILEGTGRLLDESKLAGIAPEVAPGTQAVKRVSAATRPAAEAVGAGAGKVADLAATALTPMPAPRVAALAQKATDLGIPLRPDQLSTNRVARMVGEALEKVPLSGSKADQRQVGFNRGLGKLIGAEEADRLTPDVYSRAMNKAGEKIGEIAAETPVRLDDALTAVLDDRKAHVAKRETADVGRIVNGYIDDLKEAGKEGVIDGIKFRKIESELGAQIRRSPNGDLRNALAELKEDLGDALQKNIASPERLAELKDARRKYAIGITLEPLVAKATTTGDISPGALLGRVTADRAGKNRMARGYGGDLGDLAEIGKLFLKEPISSGTGERLAAYGLLGGAGYIEPHTAAGIAGAANVYNRAGPAIVKRALRSRTLDALTSEANAPRSAGTLDALTR